MDFEPSPGTQDEGNCGGSEQSTVSRISLSPSVSELGWLLHDENVPILLVKYDTSFLQCPLTEDKIPEEAVPWWRYS